MESQSGNFRVSCGSMSCSPTNDYSALCLYTALLEATVSLSSAAIHGASRLLEKGSFGRTYGALGAISQLCDPPFPYPLSLSSLHNFVFYVSLSVSPHIFVTCFGEVGTSIDIFCLFTTPPPLFSLFEWRGGCGGVRGLVVRSHCGLASCVSVLFVCLCRCADCGCMARSASWGLTDMCKSERT